MMFALGIALLLIAFGAWALYRAVRGERFIITTLSAVAPDGLTGLDLVARSDGVLRRGTVYVLLARLEDRGLISKTPLGCRYVYSLKKAKA